MWGVAIAPRSPPTEASVKMRPNAAGLSPSSRSTKIGSSVMDAMPKKFATPVVPTMRRSSGLPNTHLRPSPISFTRGSCSSGARNFSWSRVNSSATNDERYVPTVMRIAIGAAMIPISHPPKAGPAMPASCSVDWSLPFASAI